MRKKIFIILFLALLVGPSFVWMCVSGYVDSNNTENRALAEKPQLILANLIDYPSQYEQYYNDHLPFKNELVELYALLNYRLFNVIESEKVLLGKDNWLFYKSAGVEELSDELPIADYQGINKYSEEELILFKENINVVNNYLAERNIDFSVLICPNKENIYSEYLPKDIIQVDSVSKADMLTNYLRENTEVPIIYPLDQLEHYRNKYQLYYKYDTHWNNLGGFVAEQEIKKLYLGTSESLDEYTVASTEEALKDLAIMVSMPNEFNDDEYYYVEDYKPEVYVNLLEQSADGVSHVFNSNAENKERVMVIRDSYGEALMGYLPKDFENVIFVHRNGFDRGFIDVYQPDIVIYQVVERATNDILDLKTIFGLQSE